MTSAELIVVKVGGSLLDLPDLGPRLQCWLRTLPTAGVLLVPGGGRAADVVRTMDRCHHLGEERAHWLALAALSLNARLLAALLLGCRIVGEPGATSGVEVLDPLPFVLADEKHPGRLPHSWHATSDSVAARAARVAGARELILLKSVDLPPEICWAEAARHGFVDPCFAEVIGSRLSVRAVNFRSWRP